MIYFHVVFNYNYIKQNNGGVTCSSSSDRTGSMADVCVLNAWDQDSAADTALYRIYSSKSGKKTLISTAVRDKKL